MSWMMYILGAMGVGAAILAVYERKKGIRMVQEPTEDLPHDRDIAAHTKAELIRAEAHAKQMPTSGFGIY